MGKSIDALASKFESKLTTISQGKDAIEAIQKDLTWKVDTIGTHTTEIAMKVTDLEKEYGNLQEEVILRGL